MTPDDPFDGHTWGLLGYPPESVPTLTRTLEHLQATVVPVDAKALPDYVLYTSGAEAMVASLRKATRRRKRHPTYLNETAFQQWAEKVHPGFSFSERLQRAETALTPWRERHPLPPR